ncbi:FAD-binding domain-containing protein [Myriangium duriaei CBS 260.36]|uniref:FAD-binding domain-containing protein n=1 Tax=Myriangium duriaei CBS 260.36 TaxID=1168546 RepID=A0A9P4MJE7_9PEZI|nr:FAD-binding domain-containing protein [Myriangium duriaei CBS 260.36]
MAFLNHLKETLPDVELILPSDKTFADLAKLYTLSDTSTPLAIAAPRSIDQVSHLIKAAHTHNAPVSVRSGGNDISGRAIVNNVLTIDIRALNHITIDREAGTATIGGGTNFETLAAELDRNGYMTPCGTIQWIGYVGWAILGGYGPMADKFGLGIDNLLGAKLVNAEGEVVVADEELMKGIRGAGGNFGVIVEATIKLYPFNRVLAGSILFDSTNLDELMTKYLSGIDALHEASDYPAELSVQPMWVNSPMGQIFGAVFFWADSDHERGRIYVEKIASLANAVMNTVSVVSIPEFLASVAPLVPRHAYTTCRSLSFTKMTSAIRKVIIESCKRMPTMQGPALTWHELPACSPSVHKSSSLPAVFGARRPHFVLEVLGNVVDPEHVREVAEWAESVKVELESQAAEDILDCKWVPLTPTKGLGSLDKLFGEENAAFAKKLKTDRDPNGVFRYALPPLTIE